MHEVTDKRSGQRACAKRLKRCAHLRLPSELAEAAGAEADTQRLLAAASPSILQLLDVRQDDSFFYLISEVSGLADLQASSSNS